MIDFLKYILIIVGIIILVLIVFVGAIVGGVCLLAKEDSETKKHKAKYLDWIRHIFGEDMEALFQVDNCDGKSALIGFYNQAYLASCGHPASRAKPDFLGQKGWHKITDDVYVFIEDPLDGEVCSFCYNISSRYFRSKMYLDKEEMQNSHFKKTLMSETGLNLPNDAFVIGYIDYSTRQLAPEHIYFCLSECSPQDIKSQLDILVSSTEEWTNYGNTYHFSKSENSGLAVLNIDYTIGGPFMEVIHFMD